MVLPVADISRVHNVRYSSRSDMSRVQPRFDPFTFKPDERLLRLAPVWQDKDDCRPWLELRDEMNELIRLRVASYGRDPAC